MIECGRCGEISKHEVIIPSEVWEQIAEDHYALCPYCIDALCLARGISGVPCVSYFEGAALMVHNVGIVAEMRRTLRPPEACRAVRGNPALGAGVW